MKLLVTESCLGGAIPETALLQLANAFIEKVETGADLLHFTSLHIYDAILLSLELPDMDGCEVLRQLRIAQVATPVLMLSSLTHPQAKVRAFGLGADDFLSRPCDPEELVARIKAVMRRSRNLGRTRVACGPITLDLALREVAVNAFPVHLTTKEFNMLELLVSRKGEAVSKQALLNHLYSGRDAPEIKIIEVFICKLRRKLMDAGSADLITTVQGRGYMLCDPSQACPKPPMRAEQRQSAA